MPGRTMPDTEPGARRVPTPTAPGLVQVLARLGAEHQRRRMAARGTGHLRPVHTLVLVPLLAGGRRASDLADRLGVSRQAVAQVVAVLEAGGLVERRDDPDDARAKLIVLTAAGRAALRDVRAENQALERHWAGLIGEERLGEFRRTLADLAAGGAPAPG